MPPIPQKDLPAERNNVCEPSPELETFTRQLAIDVETHIFPGKDYYMDVRTADLGNIKATMVNAGPHEAYVTDKKNSSVNKNAWTLVLQLDGELMLESEEISRKLSKGDWSLYQAPQSFRVWCLKPMQQLVMKIPECEISRLKNFIPRQQNSILNNQNKLGKIFFEFAVNSFEESASLEEETRADLAQMILQMLVFALTESAGPRQLMTSRDILRERIKLIITRRFTDPAFTIDEIAASLNCSKRYLHMIFSGTPEEGSLGQFILMTRLDKCKSELAKEQNSHVPIAQIAFSCGFNDASYFSKIFKQNLDMSPSDYRCKFNKARNI